MKTWHVGQYYRKKGMILYTLASFYSFHWIIMLLFIFIYFTRFILPKAWNILFSIWCRFSVLTAGYCGAKERQSIHIGWWEVITLFKKTILKWTAHRCEWNSCKLCMSFISMGTKRFVQFGWSLHRNIFLFCMLRIGISFWIQLIFFFLEALLNRSPIFFDYGMNPFFPLVNGWM
jgi:hypothetical protein